MSHYRSNLPDIHFNLFEVLGADAQYGTGPFADMDGDTARMVLGEVDRFARESVWADSFVPADREPLRLDAATGDVTIPDALHEALEAYYDAGWHTLPLPASLGGFGAPPSVRWAAAELFLGSNATAALWPIGALMAMIIEEVGTPGQVARFATPMVEQRWGGTMVLTEPDAGSDVGAGVTTAVRVEDNGPDDLGSVWHLSGIKRFITSADAQTHPNTVHLVLARPEGGEPGTKGLRLFIVPKHLVEADHSLGTRNGMSLGERNGIKVSNLERKMGIKGSATCELSLGQDADTPCVGYLVGDLDERGAGISMMFRVIEYARMTVGTKAMATLSTGYLNALEYARVRQQGPDLTRATDASAPRVEIVGHPDVRRLLMEQKAHTEAMRALVLFTGWVQDQKSIAADAGDAEAAAEWVRREDLLLPMVKGYCSEKAYELLGSASLQVFGGSGYTQDYPIEQYIRDAKIDTLYEGTTAIQSLDLFFRKIAKDLGQTLLWLAGQIQSCVESGPDHLGDERKALGQALEDVQGQLGLHTQQAVAALQDPEQARELYKIGLHSVALLDSLTELVMGWLLLRQADVAQRALEVARQALDADQQRAPRDSGGDDADFYTGKLAVAAYWARAVLPKARQRRELAQSEDGALMELPIEAF